MIVDNQIEQHFAPALESGAKLQLAIGRSWHLARPTVVRSIGRSIDVAAAIVLMLLLMPAILLRALVGYRATGKVASRIPKLGRDGAEIEIYKFAGDFPGRDLATLINLLRGDLALAGPRPLASGTIREMSRDPVCLSVPPGMFSPHDVRKRAAVDWESSVSTEQNYVHAAGALSGLSVVARSLLGQLLAGNPSGRSPKEFSFFGVTIRNTTMSEAIDWIVRQARSGKAAPVAFVNPDCLNKARTDDRYRQVLAQAKRVLPDGIGIQIACRMKGIKLAANLNGTDLFPRLCERAAKEGLSLYLLGARQGIADKVAETMTVRFPGLKIAGTHHGFFDEADEPSILRDINRSKADILLVAMGAPRQELWLARHAASLEPPVRMGVGGLFDFYSGRIRRAPEWMRETGLEWVWRMLMEPGRMWRRYVIGNPVFLAHVWLEARKADRGQGQISATGLRRQNWQKVFFLARRVLWQSRRSVSAFVKRSLDIVGASVGMMLLSPFLLIVAVAIRLESPGPILFRQERVGRDGELFSMIKFRSMYVDAEARRQALADQNEMSGGVLFKMKNDPRVTRVGRLIRRASVDEMPQFWNVIRGDMSLVGPRPPLPGEVDEYSVSDRQRLLVKPGITCIWQVSGRSDIPFDHQVAMDLDYIHTQSLRSDLRLLFQTIPAVLLGRGAY